MSYLVERANKESIQELPVVQCHTNDTTDERKIFLVVWIDMTSCVYLGGE